MKNRGKIVILAMISAALMAALFAWRNQYHQGARVLELWGADVSYQIRMAPRCELLELDADVSPEVETLEIANQPWRVERRSDISQARGLVHARQALIQDVSYVWGAEPAAKPNWSAALVFSDPASSRPTVTLVIDPTQGEVCDVKSGRRASIIPIAEGLRAFLDDLTVD